MSDSGLERRLRTLRAPDEAGSERRGWEVASAAYASRPPPPPRRRRRARFALVPALAAIAGVLALTPAGAAVHHWIDQTLGVKHASRELFALPAPGRILVSGPGGTWTIAADGTKRRLGRWHDAAWSPRGIYIVVASHDELAAVDPRGVPQWTIGRPDVRFPRWFGPNGYRLAYLSAGTLRVIAGDGTGDHELATHVAAVAPAWRTGHPYQIAYATGHSVVVRDADTGRAVFTHGLSAPARGLSWTADGSRLLILTGSRALVLDGAGHTLARFSPRAGGSLRDGALAPDDHHVALLDGRSITLAALPPLRPASRVLFSGAGLRQLAFSPDGHWLLVSWPAADQWIFLRAAGMPRIDASSRITEQFAATRRQSGFPELDGWCCNVTGGSG